MLGFGPRCTVFQRAFRYGPLLAVVAALALVLRPCTIIMIIILRYHLLLIRSRLGCWPELRGEPPATPWHLHV
jgi:hypothetical protein